jgi:hypothetical protein
MTARARKTALLILIGAWGLIGVWVLTQSPESQHAALMYVSGQKAKREVVRGKSGPGSDLKIQLELLAANRQRTEKSFSSPKNIFAPVFPGQAGLVMPDGRPAVPQLTPEELALQAGRQELVQYRYLGYLTRNGISEAFLAKGNVLHIAKIGDTIEQRVLVKAISPAGVILQETGTHVEETVGLAPY